MFLLAVTGIYGIAIVAAALIGYGIVLFFIGTREVRVSQNPVGYRKRKIGLLVSYGTLVLTLAAYYYLNYHHALGFNNSLDLDYGPQGTLILFFQWLVIDSVLLFLMLWGVSLGIKKPGEGGGSVVGRMVASLVVVGFSIAMSVILLLAFVEYI
jgi:multisubunit Na+/H+ antiporter MnhB subunit